MHTNHGYPPRPVENEIVKCDPQKLKHCENTKANWGPGSSFSIITFQINLLIPFKLLPITIFVKSYFILFRHWKGMQFTRK